MSPNRNLRRVFASFFLLVALILWSVPLHAEPARGGIGRVAVLGDEAVAWGRQFLERLVARWLAKEGMSIDPDGQKEGVTIDPNGQKEGVTIDPNGQKEGDDDRS